MKFLMRSFILASILCGSALANSENPNGSLPPLPPWPMPTQPGPTDAKLNKKIAQELIRQVILSRAELTNVEVTVLVREQSDVVCLSLGQFHAILKQLEDRMNQNNVQGKARELSKSTFKASLQSIGFCGAGESTIDREAGRFPVFGSVKRGNLQDLFEKVEFLKNNLISLEEVIQALSLEK